MAKMSAKDRVMHEQFSRCGKNAREWMNKCVMMLPMIEENRIWEKKKFSSIYEYAAKIAGMSRQKVDDALRVMRNIEDKPGLMKVAKEKGVNAVKPVAVVATEETAGFWAGKAMEMSKNTLEVFVKDFRSESLPRKGSPGESGLDKPNYSQEKVQLSMKLDQEVVGALKKIKGDGDWNEVMKKLLRMSERGFEKEKASERQKEEEFCKELEQEKPEAVESGARYIPVAISDFVKKRARGKCEHPNCNRSGVHIHHINPFSLNKGHDPDNLLYLCEAHHKIIHAGYIDESDGSWGQIEELPNWDIRNVVNSRVGEYMRI